MLRYLINFALFPSEWSVLPHMHHREKDQRSAINLLRHFPTLGRLVLPFRTDSAGLGGGLGCKR